MEQWKDARRLEGHVFQPLLELMGKDDFKFPRGWSARARLVPDVNEEVGKIQVQLKQASDRIWKAVTGQVRWG